MKTPPTNKNTQLRVLLLDETFDRAVLLKHALHEAGCWIAAHVASSEDLLGLVNELKPDAVILDIASPGQTLFAHLCEINRTEPCPIVMFTQDGGSATMREAMRAGVSAYVVDGLSSERLRFIMDVAMVRFKELQYMRNSLEKAEGQLAARKEIERAKGILMRQRGVTEEEAYQSLRKLAMDKGVKLADVARQVISVAGLLA